MSFTRPAPSRTDGDVRFQDLEDTLLVVVPLRVETDVPSAKGEPFDAVVCDVYGCDGMYAGRRFPGMWLIGKALQGQLAPHAGTGARVLGRLHTPQGKRYRLLGDPTPADETAALAVWPEFAGKAPESHADGRTAPPGGAGTPDDDPPPF